MEEKLYKEMYYHLFNRVSDAIAALMRIEIVTGLNILMDAQRETEEMFIGAEEESGT